MAQACAACSPQTARRGPGEEGGWQWPQWTCCGGWGVGVLGLVGV
jgi:hypothetical protein